LIALRRETRAGFANDDAITWKRWGGTLEYTILAPVRRGRAERYAKRTGKLKRVG
jgi:hypothetical protein